MLRGNTLARGDDARRLLRAAALARPDRALDAWRAWRPLCHVWPPEPASQWWLPLVWWKLRDMPIDAADMRRLRQAYHDVWIRNQHNLALAAAMVEAFERAGIETLLLKGAALALTAYERVGLRPFGDVDVLVRPANAAAARELMDRHGWVPIRAVAGSSLALRHSLGYTNGSGVDLDLHWVSLSDCGGDDRADDGFWRRSVPVDLQGVRTRALCPSDQLLHVCVHGVHWTPVPTGHWQADAVAILRRQGDAFAWDALIAEAGGRQLALQCARALRQLTRDRDVPVPAAVLASLGRQSATWWERLEYHAKRWPPSLGPLVVQQWGAAARRGAGAGRGGFVADLRAMTGVERSSQLVSRAVTRLRRRGALDTRRRVFDAFGQIVRIEGAEDLVAPVMKALPPFRSADGRSVDRTYGIARLAGDNAPARYRVTIDGQRLDAVKSVDEAAGQVASDLQTFLALTAPGATFVHAAVVALDERLIVLPGASGSGKSTLAAALLDAGATYLSDEFAVVGHDGRVEAYARPLALRGDAAAHWIPAGDYRDRAPRRPLPVDTVLFTHYSSGAAFDPVRLSPPDAVLRLLTHCPAAQKRPEETLRALRALAASAEAWVTPRGEAAVAVAALASGRLSGLVP